MEFVANVYFSVQCTLYTFIGVGSGTLLPFLTKGRKIYFVTSNYPIVSAKFMLGPHDPKEVVNLMCFLNLKTCQETRKSAKYF